MSWSWFSPSTWFWSSTAPEGVSGVNGTSVPVVETGVPEEAPVVSMANTEVSIVPVVEIIPIAPEVIPEVPQAPPVSEALLALPEPPAPAAPAPPLSPPPAPPSLIGSIVLTKDKYGILCHGRIREMHPEKGTLLVEFLGWGRNNDEWVAPKNIVKWLGLQKEERVTGVDILLEVFLAEISEKTRDQPTGTTRTVPISGCLNRPYLEIIVNNLEHYAPWKKLGLTCVIPGLHPGGYNKPIVLEVTRYAKGV